MLGRRQFGEERGESDAGLLTLAQDHMDLGFRVGKEADLVVGRAVLPARTHDFHAHFLRCETDNFRLELVAHFRGDDIVGDIVAELGDGVGRSEEHTSELQSLMRISYAVFCLKKKKKDKSHQHNNNTSSSECTDKKIIS